MQSQNLTTSASTTGAMSNPSSCSVVIQARTRATAATASGFLFVLGGSPLQAPAEGSALATVQRAVYEEATIRTPTILGTPAILGAPCALAQEPGGPAPAAGGRLLLLGVRAGPTTPQLFNALRTSFLVGV